MRNKYPGICNKCKDKVNQREGNFIKIKETWQLLHAICLKKSK